MRRFIIVSVILVSAIIYNSVFTCKEVSLDRKRFADFPVLVGDWKSVGDQAIGESSMKVLLVDDYLLRTYINKDSKVINLYIGYFYHQREGKQIHSPRQCLPGAGFTIENQKLLEVSYQEPSTKKFPANFYLMKQGDERFIYIWWYQGRGRKYANEYWNKLYQMYDSVALHRNDGALVRIDMKVDGDINQTLIYMNTYIHAILPLLSQYIPER
jgi:EpsI family protein